jgi:outer membrane protein assembly factor BamD (BamD/ComL family)
MGIKINPQKDIKAFEKYLEEAVKWIRENQERFWAVFGSALLALLFIGLLIHHRQTESEEAWMALGTLQGQLMQQKYADVRKGLDDWQARYSGSDAASYAKFMQADLLYRTTDYAQASQVYGDIAQTGAPDVIRPLALSAQIDCEEMAGHIPQAQALAQTFLDRYPDHFLAAPRYMSQARLSELAGNSAAAAAIYERFVLLFPQSPWTALAHARLQALGAPAVPSPAPSLK